MELLWVKQAEGLEKHIPQVVGVPFAAPGWKMCLQIIL